MEAARNATLEEKRRTARREILLDVPPAILIDHVRDGLSALSDKAHQRNVWMRLDNGGQMDSFEEAVCRVFDDSGLGDALDKGKAVPLIGEEAVEHLKALRRLVGRVPIDQPVPDLVVESDAMDSVRDAARTATNSLPEVAASDEK